MSTTYGYNPQPRFLQAANMPRPYPNPVTSQIAKPVKKSSSLPTWVVVAGVAVGGVVLLKALR